MSDDIKKIVSRLPTEIAKAVLYQRELHACLMELPIDKVVEVQTKAVYLNYLSGEGKRFTGVPHYYDRKDNKGEVQTVYSSFRHIDDVPKF